MYLCGEWGRENEREKGREDWGSTFCKDYLLRVGLGGKQKKLYASLLFEFIILCIIFIIKASLDFSFN